MGDVNYVMSVAVGCVGLAAYLSWHTHFSVAYVAALSVLVTATWFAHIAWFVVLTFLPSILHLSAQSARLLSADKANERGWMGKLRA